MFPYSEASWSVVDGAMFMGWGTALPGITTLIAQRYVFLFLLLGKAQKRRNLQNLKVMRPGFLARSQLTK
ncbi:MAG: hypothetical protein CM15mP54_03030 [Paracoccaceae bacterium]|nr:MAG: hypothetical protein CM15mP54_03030 [Paracoccaceae bacterium]